MKCSNCGFVNADGTKYCVACGSELAPQYTQPGFDGGRAAGKHKRKSAKLPVLITSIVLGVALVAFLCFTLLTSTPMGLVATGAKKTAQAIENSELVKAAKSVSEHGSVSVDVDAGQLFESLAGMNPYYSSEFYYIADMLGDSSVNVTLYSELKNKSGAVTFNAVLDGDKLADGMVWAGEDSIGASSKALLGNTAYGIDLKNIKKTLPRSIFNPGNDTYYPLPEELYNSLMSDGVAVDTEKLEKDIAGVARNAGAVLAKSFKKNAEIGRNTEHLDFGSSSKAVTAVRISLDDEGLQNMILDVLHWAQNDEALRELLVEISVYADMTGTDIVDEFYDAVNELCDEDELEYYFEDVELSAIFYVTKSGKQLVGIDLNVDDDGDETFISVIAGPDMSSPDKIAFTYEDSWEKVTGSYTVSERSADAYSAKLRIKEDSYTLTSGSIDWNKKNGSLTVSLSDLLELNANMLRKGNATTVKVEELWFDDGWDSFDIYDPGVTVVINESAKLPSVPVFEDLARITDEDEFEDILYSIEDNVYDFADQIESLIY